jgi:hypothetical protein
LAGVGLVFLWLSIVGAVFLIFEVVVGAGAAIAVAAALVVLFLAVWYAYPWQYRNDGRG